MLLIRLGFVALTSATLCSSTLAQTSPETKKFCTSLSELAGAAMKARQNGASMAKLMSEDVKSFQALWEMMVEEAFQTSRFSTEDYKKRAEEDFANKWYMYCLKAKK